MDGHVGQITVLTVQKFVIKDVNFTLLFLFCTVNLYFIYLVNLLCNYYHQHAYDQTI